MANVPAVPGPSVAPVGGNQPLQSVNPAGAFDTGAGLSGLGSAAQEVSDQASQRALQLQGLNNKAAADNAYTTFADQAGQASTQWQLAHKELNATDDALAQHYKDLQQMRVDAGQGLSPMAQAEYDSASRRVLQYSFSDSAKYAATQQNQGRIKANEAGIQTSQAIAAASYGKDPDSYNDAMADIAKRSAGAVDLYGLTPEEGEQNLRKNVGGVFTSLIRQSLDSGNYQSAQGLYDQHKGDMTIEQINQVAGALKASQNAYVVHDAANDWLAGFVGSRGPNSGGGAANNPYNLKNPANGGQWNGTVSTQPNGIVNFDSTASADRALNQVLSHYADRGISNPTDFVNTYASSSPANEKSAYIQAITRAAGTDFDLHDPATQAAIRSAIVKQEGNSGGASGGFGPATDPAQIRAAGEASIMQYADTHFAGNPVQHDQFISSAVQKLNITVGMQTAAQNAAYDRLNQPVSEGRISDPSQLMSAYPGASDDYSTLSPQLQTRLQNGMDGAMYKRPTGDQLQNQLVLQGMAKATPDAFATEDLNKYDLTPMQRVQISTAQKQAQATKDRNDSNVKTWLSNPTIGQYVKTNFPDRTSPQYLGYVGAVAGQVEALEARTGKPADQKDFTQIGASLAAGAQTYQVPTDAAGKITWALQQHGNAHPTPYQISEMYQRYLASRAPR